MPRSTVRLCLAWAAALALAAQAPAVIQRLTPLKEVLALEQHVFTVVVEKLDAGAPSAVLAVKEDLKGKAPYRRLPVSLVGDIEAQKTNQTAQLLDRLVDGLPLVVFASAHDKRLIAYVYSNGTWFQLVADRVEGQDAFPSFRFTHFEPYLRRTFKGTTVELQQVVTDGLSGKKAPPEPDPKEPPGLGPPMRRAK